MEGLRFLVAIHRRMILAREHIQLGNDGVSGPVRVAWRSAAQLSVRCATARLATALEGAKQCGRIDLDFILTVRTNNFHAAKLTYRLPLSY